MKLFFFFLFVPVVSLFSGSFEEHLLKEGEELRYVQTQEDKKRLEHYAAMFEMGVEKQNPMGAIPKTLHFIWLGPKPFPQESVKNLRGWIDLHPGWRVKFWTDQERDLPDSLVEQSFFSDFPLKDLKECYYHSDNFGERSEVLRYAILLDEGGVYVDHDVECLKPIDPLQSSHDFFCGMEPFSSSVLSSSVNPSPHLIGAVSGHPILEATKGWLKKEWDRLEGQYPGTDVISVFNRTQHRAFCALGMGIGQGQNREGRKDVVFPPDYFSSQERELAEYAVHHHLGTWHVMESESELKVRRLLTETVGDVNHLSLLVVGLILVNVAVGGVFFYKLFRRGKEV